jgi:hypothetical protein
VGWTYNHQPYLCYWNDRFYFQYLSNFLEEHNPPGRTLIMHSDNGRDWSDPEVAFPVYSLPEITIPGEIWVPEGTKSVMHQRMGFYVAPNGKLRTFAFYGFAISTGHSPNTGNGLGRVVREIHPDGSMGPIYFIRYNRHAGFNESNTSFPFYRESEDQGFLEACEAVLGDKLMSLQWWEEDRARDGFYTIDPGKVEGAFDFTVNMTTSRGPGKAFNYYERPDGVIVGIWKNQWTGLSTDQGQSWLPLVRSPSISAIGAKTWGQRTDDGRYALVYNHSPIRSNRFPMCVMTGDDGRDFDDLLCLQGEVPIKRYKGEHKPWGSQYIRGIMPPNGNPPGDHLWNVYSMNKEDIWITRTRLPVAGRVEDYVEQDFDGLQGEEDLEYWNLYNPKWCRSAIVSDGHGGKCLALNDRDPCDYNLVERVFPESETVAIEFDLKSKQGRLGRLEIDVTSVDGLRAVKIALSEKGRIEAVTASEVVDLGPYPVDEWQRYVISIREGSYALAVDGVTLVESGALADKVDRVQRLVLRTGLYRGIVPESGKQEEDVPYADIPVPNATFLIDNLAIQP